MNVTIHRPKSEDVDEITLLFQTVITDTFEKMLSLKHMKVKLII